MLNGRIKAYLSYTDSISGYLSSEHTLSSTLTKENSISGELFKEGSYKTLYSDISKIGSISGTLSSEKTISGQLSVDILPEPYMGEYEVTPKTVEQYLDTDRKYMKKDVTVFEIPYAETSNVYGTTVTIAS